MNNGNVAKRTFECCLNCWRYEQVNEPASCVLLFSVTTHVIGCSWVRVCNQISACCYQEAECAGERSRVCPLNYQVHTTWEMTGWWRANNLLWRELFLEHHQWCVRLDKLVSIRRSGRASSYFTVATFEVTVGLTDTFGFLLSPI